jgi:transcriptional regulator with XRE-family HTH domain
MSIGSRLREERERLGWTQPQMAEKGRVSKRSQIDYEQDNIEAKAAYLAALSGAGVDVAYVLTGKRSIQSGLSDAEQFVVSVLRQMDEFARQSLFVVFERLAAVRTVRREAPHVAAEAQSGKSAAESLGAAPINEERLAACLQAIEERRPRLSADKKAAAAIALYKLVQHEPSTPPRDELIKLISKAA